MSLHYGHREHSKGERKETTVRSSIRDSIGVFGRSDGNIFEDLDGKFAVSVSRRRTTLPILADCFGKQASPI